MLRLTLAALTLAAAQPAAAQDQATPPDLVASETLAGATLPAGTSLKVEATFQDLQVSSPTALTFDDQGRIYLAETHRRRHGVMDDRDHLYWYLDDLACKKTADRLALHEKWHDKISIAQMTEKSELVRRLADTDGDGKLDESKVFATGFNDTLDGSASGVFFYEGSLYFSCIPKIYALRDTDGDGTADERKVVEQGFGVRVSLAGHDLNGFTLGPDGRIYGTVGDRGLSLITKAGVSYDYPGEGAAFRFEPDGSGFEIFHTGLRNPKEIAFDTLGNAYTVDGQSDQGDAARIVYLVDGGDSGWRMEHQAMHTFHPQIGLSEHPPSRWMDEKMWELESPQQPAFMLPPSGHLTTRPLGLTAHPGTGFLASEAGRFLVCDHGSSSKDSGIWSFAMKPKGAGMEMSDSRKLVWGVAATDVKYSWDGKIFLTDSMGGGESQPEGRLLSLDAGANTWLAEDAKSAAKLMKEGMEARSSAVLANLLKHPDARIRLRAHIALTRKSDALQRLTEAADSSNFMVRIHAIQGLGIIARRGSSPLPVAAFGDIPTAKNRQLAEQKLVALLKDKSAEIRAQSLRALADSNIGANEVPLGPLLGDESPRVCYFAAILAGKRGMIGYYGPICEMLAENNNRDVYLRHAGIFALQRMADNKPNILIGLFQDESPAIRLAAVVALRRMKSAAITSFIHDADPKVMDEVIRAVGDLDITSARPEIATLLDDLTQRPWSPFMLRRLIHNAFRVGTRENASRLLKLAADPTLPDSIRTETMRLLATWTEPFPVDQLTGNWRPLEKRPLTTLRPALLAALPGLLKKDSIVRPAAIGLAKQYQLDPTR
jgi:quinoprotein glucose dehydrogenase